MTNIEKIREENFDQINPTMQVIYQMIICGADSGLDSIILTKDNMEEFCDNSPEINFFNLPKDEQEKILKCLKKKHFKVKKIFESDEDEINTGFIFDVFVNMLMDLTNGLVGSKDHLTKLEISWKK